MHRVLCHSDEAIAPTKESMALWQACVEFIVLHELGHIINGHIRSKVLNHNDALERFLTHRTIELDADCFAIQTLTGRALHESSSPNYVGYDLLKNTRLRLLTFMTAVAVVIYMFEAHAREKAGEYQTSTHPPLTFVTGRAPQPPLPSLICGRQGVWSPYAILTNYHNVPWSAPFSRSLR